MRADFLCALRWRPSPFGAASFARVEHYVAVKIGLGFEPCCFDLDRLKATAGRSLG